MERNKTLIPSEKAAKRNINLNKHPVGKILFAVLIIFGFYQICWKGSYDDGLSALVISAVFAPLDLSDGWKKATFLSKAILLIYIVLNILLIGVIGAKFW